METAPIMEPPLHKDRFAWMLLAVAIFLAGGFFTLTWRTGDDARYIGLARSLLIGDGYTLSYLPHNPPETITPPAQPAMIALSMLLFGRGVVPGQLFSDLMFVLGTLAVYAWARRQLGDRRLACCATIIGQFAFAILTMTCWYMVEVHFIAASYLVLALADRDPKSRGSGTVFIIGLLAGYVYLIRATGLAFAAAGGLYFLARREWRNLFVFCAGFLLLAAPWMVRSYLVTGATEAYISFQSGIVGAQNGYPWMRIPHDIANAFPVYFVQALPDALFYRLMGEYGLMRKVGLGALEPLVRWVILALVAGGFLARLRRPRLGDIYWIFFWLIITSPPFPPQGHWYVYPLLPMAAVYMVEAVRGLSRLPVRLRPSFQWQAPRLAMLIVAALALYSLATACTGAIVQFSKERQRWGLAPWAPERYTTYKNEYLDAWGRFVEAGLWASSNFPPDTLIVSRQPNHMHLITGHEGWRYDLPEVPGSNLYERLVMQSVQHPVVLLEDAFQSYAGASFSYGVGHWALQDLFEKHADQLKLVHECGPPDTRVWLFSPNLAEQTAENSINNEEQ